VVGLAALDEEARQRLGDDLRAWLGAVHVQVTQGLGDVPPPFDGTRELVRCPPRLAS
jgi:hypothetical protein